MEVKRRIIEQASNMFFRYGIRTITMDEIAESLGISKRTLYESFATKEDLLKECIEFQHSENLKMRDEVMREVGDDPLEVIHRHFRHAMIMKKPRCRVSDLAFTWSVDEQFSVSDQPINDFSKFTIFIGYNISGIVGG
jgi:AcrR family transcriptional regulator